MFGFVTETLMTTLALVALALGYWAAIIAVLRFSQIQLEWAQVVVMALLPTLGIFVLALPAFLFALLNFQRPGLDTLPKVLAFESLAVRGVVVIIGVALLVGAAIAIRSSLRNGASVVAGVLVTVALAVVFMALTSPLWDLWFSCAIGRPLVWGIPC